MSTKAIRKALDMVDVSLSDYRESASVRDEALAELKALRHMARVLLAPHGHDRDTHGQAWAMLQALAEEGEATP